MYKCNYGHDTSGVTANAGDVLQGKVIVDADGNPLTGTMPNNGTLYKNICPAGNFLYARIPRGYHDGNGLMTIYNSKIALRYTKDNSKVLGPCTGGGYNIAYDSVAYVSSHSGLVNDAVFEFKAQNNRFFLNFANKLNETAIINFALKPLSSNINVMFGCIVRVIEYGGDTNNWVPIRYRDVWLPGNAGGCFNAPNGVSCEINDYSIDYITLLHTRNYWSINSSDGSSNNNITIKHSGKNGNSIWVQNEYIIYPVVSASVGGSTPPGHKNNYSINVETCGLSMGDDSVINGVTKVYNGLYDGGIIHNVPNDDRIL